MNDRNRRQHDRHNVAADIEIFHNGYAIEFPTKDISVSGMGIESLGVSHLKIGDKVLVVLSQETEVAAEVVSIRKDSLHLKFTPDSMEDVEYYLEVKAGAKPIKSPER